MQDDASYTLTDLLMDDSFRAWIQSGGQENEQYWLDWMNKHPDKVHLIEEARQMLVAFEIDPFLIPEDSKDKLRNKIEVISKKQSLNGNQTYTRAEPQKAIVRFPQWSQIAAVGLLLLAATAMLYLWLQRNDGMLEYSTGQGEIRRFLLPDSSWVTLNANTKLTFSPNWNEQDDRQVWLDGEAYFEVEKHPLREHNKGKELQEDSLSHQKFMVITPNLVVEVIGTKFNVNKGSELTEVVLNSGSVKLQLSEQEIWMQPGDYVTVSSQENAVTKKAINPENYTAWRIGQLYFDSASIDEIRQTLEDNYGLVIEFEDWQKTVDVSLRGAFPTDNLNVLLQALANTTDTEMTRKGNQVFYQ